MSPSNASSPLQAVLGEPPPPSIEQLDADAQAALAGLLTTAIEAQQTAMETALEDSLRYVPALLRGAVRRVLFP